MVDGVESLIRLERAVIACEREISSSRLGSGVA